MHRHASLNRVYRLVWSHVHRTWVVVAETARGRGKRANRKLMLATAAVALASANLAQAGPTGGQVTAGTGSVTQSGNTTTVNQSSQNLALTWQSFNTSPSETVNFVQPSRSAIAVNRILDSNGTQFMGKLNANGQVWLVNPNGVLFGAGSQVNVGGLVASTLDVADSALGDAARRFSGDGRGSVVNQGSVSAAEGGYVAFIGNKVGNQGSASAPLGTVLLGAGSDVTLSFAGNSLLNMQVNRGTLDNLAENGGLLRADGGAVIMTAGARDAVLASVVNNTGVIQARSVREVNGAVVLDGGQHSSVSNAGTLDASGRAAGEQGGSVRVLGENVALAAGSRIDVAGDQGGGSAYVGGNFLGAGPEQNARSTSVAAGSRIDADALSAGDGGRVAVWSDGATRFDGGISARGGAAGGNGGAVETSGARLKVGAGATVDTSAARGATGNWLLDPEDITIGSKALFGENYGIDVDSATLTNALNTSNVTIKTTASGAGNGDIVLLDSIGTVVSATDGNGNATDFALWDRNDFTLTLSAYRNIRFAKAEDFGIGGALELGHNNDGGRVVLKADNSGTGIGAVLYDDPDWNYLALGARSKIDIYYNPVSYQAPVDHRQRVIMGDASQVTSYMAVNVAAVVANKTYDGTTTAALGSIGLRSTLPDGLSVKLDGASAAFADKHAGIGKSVNLSNIVFDGAGGGGTTISYNGNNYYLNGLDAQRADIGKASLALSGVTANGKTYDGTTAASLSGTAQVTALAGDVVAVTGSGAGSTFLDKNAGFGKAVTVRGYTLSGSDANNYALVAPVGLTANIDKAQVSVTNVTVNSKTYDGTTAATVSGVATVAAFGSDSLSLMGYGSASFADRNAGTGKAVTVTGYTLGGSDAGNYDLLQPSGLTANINKAGLVLNGLGVADKVYDGTTAATLTGIAGVTAFGADQVSVSGSGSAVFVDKNAGAGKAVVVSGYTLSGQDAGNYTILPSGGLSATIGKADLYLEGLTAHAKVYDGGTAATLSGMPSVRPLGSDVVTLGGSGSGVFADKNAGSGKAVMVSGYVLGGADGTNYNLRSQAGLNADIVRANVQVQGIVASDKTYDGGTAAMLSGAAFATGRGSDQLIVGGSGVASFADKNAGAGKAVLVSGYTLGGLDAGNYNLVQPSGLSATINKAGLALEGLSVADKVYDGTTAAVLGGSASVRGIGADEVGVSGSGSAVFADKNAGAGKAVVVSGYTLSGRDADNYMLLPSGGLSASIAKADLALHGLSAHDKTYDGTTWASLSGMASVTAIGGDVVTLSGSGSAMFADKNAGNGKAVSVVGYTLSGADAGNYRLVAPSGLTATIGRASLAVIGVSANNKTYDGGTVATLSGAATVAAFGSDQVAVGGGGSAAFVDKNAGKGKAVAVSGYTLTGDDAGNYDLLQPSGLQADIGKAKLALEGLVVADKAYDGTTAATLTGSAGVTAFGADQVGVSGSGSAAFLDKNAGAGKAVTVSGFSLSGLDAGNYELLPATGMSATIARADLVLSGLSADDKVYDGGAAATLNGLAQVTPIGNDMVTVSGSGSGTFADKNAGANKAVTVSGYSLSGLDAGNYQLRMPSGLSATIARASLAVQGASVNGKTYDGTTAATLAGNAGVSAIGADQVSLVGGKAEFGDKNAGSGKKVFVSGYALTGVDAGNYELVQPTGVSADIAKASLAVTGLGARDKVYDGDVGAALGGEAKVAAFGQDEVAVGGTARAAFADKNAGEGKAVAVSGLVLEGRDSGNYELVQPAGLRANIARADLAVTGVSANGKTYDGSTAATLSGAARVAAFGADQVAVAGVGNAVFADRNAGSGKAVTVSGYTLSGLDAGNYRLVQPVGLRADIAKASLAVSGIRAADKTFDGGVGASVDTSAVVFGGLVEGDRISVASSGSFADAAVGEGKTVMLSNAYSGADIGNYIVASDQASAQAAITPAANAQLNGIVTQVQSAVLPLQSGARPDALGVSSTLLVTSGEGERPAEQSDERVKSIQINTRVGAGAAAPRLQIQNGGMQLPPLASTITE